LAFQRIPGVVETEVGYCGGQAVSPTYEEVMRGGTGHVQAVRVRYHPAAIAVEELLDFYWDFLVDPTQSDGQGDDVGPQFCTGVFVASESQLGAVLQAKQVWQKKFSKPLATRVEMLLASAWYPADPYLQQYLQGEQQSARKGDITPIRQYG
jgi:peptide-methionine (S)-S-oxide reductase